MATSLHTSLPDVATMSQDSFSFPNPESTMSATTFTGEIDVSMPTRACQECHRKKTKCDMRHPVCGLCTRISSLCEYPSMRKRPSRSGTKQQHREKLQKVDDHLSTLVRLLENDSTLAERPIRPALWADPHPQPPPPPHSIQQARSVWSDEQEVRSVGRLDNPLVPAPPSPHSTNTQSSPGQTLEHRIEYPEVSSPAITVSHELASHLLDVYFEKVAPWLPLIHKPQFMQRCSQHFCQGPDALANLPPEDIFILLSMFALAARYSSLDRCWSGPPRDRGRLYAREAQRMYPHVRNLQEPSLRYLQGCILLAFYLYTSGMALQCWVLVGVCVHFALDLGLSDLDDENRAAELPSSPIEQEELRRTWWAVWELDTFGSMILLRPFVVDRRHVAVKLPISDQAWFAGDHVKSDTLRLHKQIDWTALCASPNQSERAWFLVAYSILAKIYDRLLLRESISVDEQTVLENEISCVKLALPPNFQQRPEHLGLDNGPAANNWIIGTHLLLSTASYLIHVLSSIKDDKSLPPEERNDLVSRERFRVVEMSAILRMWPPSCIPTAHPFLSVSLCPLFGSPTQTILDSPTYQSFDKLASLVQTRFGEKWDLGQLALRMCRVS